TVQSAVNCPVIVDQGRALEAWPTLASYGAERSMGDTATSTIANTRGADCDEGGSSSLLYRGASIDMGPLEFPTTDSVRAMEQQPQLQPLQPQLQQQPGDSLVEPLGAVAAVGSDNPVYGRHDVAGFHPSAPAEMLPPAVAELEEPWYASAQSSASQAEAPAAAAVAAADGAVGTALPSRSVTANAARSGPPSLPSSPPNIVDEPHQRHRAQTRIQVREEAGLTHAGPTPAPTAGVLDKEDEEDKEDEGDKEDEATDGRKTRSEHQSPVGAFATEMQEEQAVPPLASLSLEAEAEAAVQDHPDALGPGSRKVPQAAEEDREADVSPTPGNAVAPRPRTGLRRTTFAASVHSGGGGDGDDNVDADDPSEHVRHIYVPHRAPPQSARYKGDTLGDVSVAGPAAGATAAGDMEDEAARRRAAQRRASSARSTASRPTSAVSRRHLGGSSRRRHVTQSGIAEAPSTAGAVSGDADGEPDAALRSLRTGLGRTISSSSRRAGRTDDGSAAAAAAGGNSANGGAGTIAQLSRAAAVVGNAQGGRKVVMDVMVVRPQPRRAHHGERRTDSLNDGGGGGGGSDMGSDDSDLEQLRRSLHPRSGSVLAGAAARSRPMTASSARSGTGTTKSRPSTSRPSTSRPSTAHQRPTTAASRRSVSDDYPDPHSHHHHRHHQYDSARPVSAARSVRSTSSFGAHRPSSSKSTKSMKSRRRISDPDSDDLSTISDISDVADFSDVAEAEAEAEAEALAPQARHAARLQSARFRSETALRNHHQNLHANRFGRAVKTESGIFPGSEGNWQQVDGRGPSRSTHSSNSFNRSMTTRKSNSFERETTKTMTKKTTGLGPGAGPGVGPAAGVQRGRGGSNWQSSDVAASAGGGGGGVGDAGFVVGGADADDGTNDIVTDADADADADLKATTLAKLVAADELADATGGKADLTAPGGADAPPRGPTMAMVRE
ncbi:hypothetical protein Vretifemale_7624, partial [Volvox reticuliferus]